MNTCQSLGSEKGANWFPSTSNLCTWQIDKRTWRQKHWCNKSPSFYPVLPTFDLHVSKFNL